MNAMNNPLSKWLCEEPTLGGRIRRAVNEPKDLPPPRAGEHFWVQVEGGTAEEQCSFVCESVQKFFAERGYRAAMTVETGSPIINARNPPRVRGEDVTEWKDIVAISKREHHYKIVWLADFENDVNWR